MKKTKKMKTTKLINKKNKKKTINNKSKISLIIFIVAFIAIGAFVLFKTFAATSSELLRGSVEGEALTGSGAIMSENLGITQFLRLTTSTPAVNSNVNVSSNGDQIVIIAKGVQCKGAPSMVVSLDDKDIATIAVSSTAWAPYKVPFKITAGTHKVAVRMTNPLSDYKGNSTKLVCTRALDLDKLEFKDIPPQVNITSPKNGDGVINTVNVAASATDLLGISKVELYIDNQLFGSALTSSPYSWNWDTKTYPLGTHTLYAKAYDVSGLEANSTIITVTKGNCSIKSVPSGVPTMNMTLCDDFNENAVDTNVWEDCSWSQKDSCHGNALTNQQLEWNRLANCSVSNGSLNLNAIRGSFTSPKSTSYPNGVTYPWTSCLLATKNLRIQYGYIEEKSKFPPVKGFWPAFWTYQPSFSGTETQYNTETDVYEYYSDNKYKITATQHDTPGGGCNWGGKDKPPINLSFDPSADFHTYGAYISPAGTFWYIDGQQLCSTSAKALHPGVVITNLAVFATNPPDNTTNQATKQVDYIKVFQ